jgi:gamma-glutamylputrescine oxidase
MAPHPPSYYAASVTTDARYPLMDGSIDCDVCIVGGGYTGLHAALELAERGFDVVLLEAERIGWGASGRNGGQIVTNFARGMDDIEARFGVDDCKRFWSIAEEAKSLLHKRVAEHDIDCDLKQGYLYAANKPSHYRALEEEADAWQSRYGYDKLKMVPASEIEAHVETSAYCGGMLDAGGGHLHPLNYALGLARAAKAAGARLFEGTRVSRLDTSERPTAHTAKGLVRARFMLVCCNAYLAGLERQLQGYIMPVATYLIATAQLSEAQAAALIPRDVAIADMNFVLNYYRLSADRRLLFGGALSYSTFDLPNLERVTRRRMTRVFPQLRDVATDHVWGGYVAITRSRYPHLGRLGPTTYFAHGFSGHGVALSGMSGRLMAEAIAGQAERFDLMARLPHRRFPGGAALRTPLLVLATSYFRLRDLL